MGAGHSIGAKASTRLACNRTEVSYPIDIPSKHPSLANLNAGKLLAFIKATTLKPCIIEAEVYVQTAFDGTTPQLLVGTSATGNQLIASGDVTEGTPGFYPANNAVKKLYISADTSIYCSISATDMTVGRAHILLKITELNMKSLS